MAVPGPCPVIFNGGSDDAEAAVAAGASAVVVAAADVDIGEAVTKSGVEVIWNVESAEQVEVAFPSSYMLRSWYANKTPCMMKIHHAMSPLTWFAPLPGACDGWGWRSFLDWGGGQ
eukprot:1500777-Rhodomonas_salina.2